MFKRTVFAAVLLLSAALPAGAQDIATRIFQMEERIRQLTGQVEELNFTVNRLQQQLGAQQTGDAGTPPALLPKTPPFKKLAAAPVTEGSIEVIEDTPMTLPTEQKVEILGTENDAANNLAMAPAPKALGSGANSAAQSDDGGFQGQVLVPLNEGEQAQTQTAVTSEGDANSDGIEQVSLAPAVETPESLYKNSNEALLRRQFPEAEAGFRNFLAKYPDHSLAGSAQYWLGETYYVQGDVRQAAQGFLEAYKRYPKSRRAPDSLLKLGMSLGKLGQKEQACAALGSVGDEFPRAVEAKKRATAEFKRAGC